MWRIILALTVVAALGTSEARAAAPYCPLGGTCRSAVLICVVPGDYMAGPLPAISIVPPNIVANAPITASVRYSGNRFADASLAPIIEVAGTQVRIYQMIRELNTEPISQTTCTYEIGPLVPGAYHLELWEGTFTGPVKALASKDFTVNAPTALAEPVPTTSREALAMLTLAVLAYIGWQCRDRLRK